jgi:hypothetical protein
LYAVPVGPYPQHGDAFKDGDPVKGVIIFNNHGVVRLWGLRSQTYLKSKLH